MLRQSAIKVHCHFCWLCREGHLNLDDGGLSFVQEMHSALHCVRGEFRFFLFLCVPSSNFSQDHLNQFSHASSCSSNGIFSLTQGLHVDGRLASLPSSLCMWAMIIPFARCQVSVTCSFPGCLASPHICLRPPQGLASFSPHLLLPFALTLAVARPTCRLAVEHTVSKAETAGTLSRAC